MHAGCGDTGGSDENSGDARCEGSCLPRPTAAARLLRGPSLIAPPGRDGHAIPASAGLAVEKAWRATERVAFPDPPSDALRASASLAIANAWGATERVVFPDPPSDTSDPGKTRKAASPNEPGNGRTGKAATPMDSPNEPGNGRITKSATVRNTVRLGSPGRAGVLTLFRTIRSVLPPIPAWSQWPSAKQSHRSASRCRAQGLQQERRKIGRNGRTLTLVKARTCRGRASEISDQHWIDASRRMGA
jgi:hypothetical protein